MDSKLSLNEFWSSDLIDSAISRGFFPNGLAKINAMFEAKSPCSGLFGR
jgi:hypothetical protein